MLRSEVFGPAGASTDLVSFPVPVSSGSLEGSSDDRPLARVHGHPGAGVPFNGLAFTAPFRLLSPEGVAALRSVIAANEKHARALPDRAAKSLRGLGYRSRFIRDFNYCEQIRAHLGKMAGSPLGPHDMSSNLSQTNFGEIGGDRPVDAWHIDSVPYVMVLLLSDATDMKGGQLQVARLNGGDPKLAIDKIQAEGIDAKFVDTVNYPGPGYAVFMQGSRIAHCVTPVEAAREPRLTVVNSYQSLNPFSLDRTKYVTFTDVDGDQTAGYEFARHAAWRVQGQLDFLLRGKRDPTNGATGLFDEPETVVDVLDRAAAELQRARDLVSGRVVDERPYKIQKEKTEKKPAPAATTASDEEEGASTTTATTTTTTTTTTARSKL